MVAVATAAVAEWETAMGEEWEAVVRAAAVGAVGALLAALRVEVVRASSR